MEYSQQNMFLEHVEQALRDISDNNNTNLTSKVDNLPLEVQAKKLVLKLLHLIEDTPVAKKTLEQEANANTFIAEIYRTHRQTISKTDDFITILQKLDKCNSSIKGYKAALLNNNFFQDADELIKIFTKQKEEVGNLENNNDNLIEFCHRTFDVFCNTYNNRIVRGCNENSANSLNSILKNIKVDNLQSLIQVFINDLFVEFSNKSSDDDYLSKVYLAKDPFVDYLKKEGLINSNGSVNEEKLTERLKERLEKLDADSFNRVLKSIFEDSYKGLKTTDCLDFKAKFNRKKEEIESDYSKTAEDAKSQVISIFFRLLHVYNPQSYKSIPPAMIERWLLKGGIISVSKDKEKDLNENIIKIFENNADLKLFDRDFTVEDFKDKLRLDTLKKYDITKSIEDAKNNASKEDLEEILDCINKLDSNTYLSELFEENLLRQNLECLQKFLQDKSKKSSVLDQILSFSNEEEINTSQHQGQDFDYYLNNVIKGIQVKDPTQNIDRDNIKNKLIALNSDEELKSFIEKNCCYEVGGVDGTMPGLPILDTHDGICIFLHKINEEQAKIKPLVNFDVENCYENGSVVSGRENNCLIISALYLYLNRNKDKNIGDFVDRFLEKQGLNEEVKGFLNKIKETKASKLIADAGIDPANSKNFFSQLVNYIRQDYLEIKDRDEISEKISELAKLFNTIILVKSKGDKHFTKYDPNDVFEILEEGKDNGNNLKICHQRSSSNGGHYYFSEEELERQKNHKNHKKQRPVLAIHPGDLDSVPDDEELSNGQDIPENNVANPLFSSFYGFFKKVAGAFLSFSCFGGGRQ